MTLSELRTLTRTVKYKDWVFAVSKTKGGDLYVQVQFRAWDNKLGAIEEQHGRKWYISNYAVRSEVIGTLFKAVITAEEHEARETFTYRGQAIFKTHYNVDALVDLCGQGDLVLDTRRNKWI